MVCLLHHKNLSVNIYYMLRKDWCLMPGLLTHYLFGVEVNNSLSPNYIKDILKTNSRPYNLGLQGPDIFFYHIPTLILKGKKNIGNTIHHKAPALFFENMLDYINKLKREDEKEICIAYMSGFICHNDLDVQAHPYIRYRSREDLDPKKGCDFASCHHRQIETIIDTMILKEYRQTEPGRMNLESLVSVKKKEITAISKCLYDTIHATFPYRISRKTIIKCIYALRRNVITIQSGRLSSRIPIRIFEKLTFHGPIISCQRYDLVTDDSKDYLNRGHRPWKLTQNSDDESTESFVELFEKAKRHSRDSLECLDNTLSWGTDPSIFLATIREDPGN